MPSSENPERHQVEPADEEFLRAGTPRWVGVALILLAVTALGALWFSHRSVRNTAELFERLDNQTQISQKQTRELANALTDRLAQVEEQNSKLRREVDTLTGQLETVQDDARLARKQAQRVRDQAHQEVHQMMVMDADVRNQLAAKANVEDLRTIRSDVSGVQGQIQATNATLKMSRSDMGVLIARNHDQIEVLRQRGDRDYFEFTISGKNASEKMGDITVTLRSTDPRKNECNLELFVDDRATQKRNRSINEPIFFYKQGERLPSEIVINDVKKNEVVGYLSVPKEKQQIIVAGTDHP